MNSYQHFSAASPKTVRGNSLGMERPVTQGDVSPCLVRGSGAHCWDSEGIEYIDFMMAFGANLLGYAYPAVNEAIREQLGDGVLFSLDNPLQGKLIQRLTEIFPCADTVVLQKTGSAATSSAVRIARAHTGRQRVIRCGYHGWHDWCADGIMVEHPTERTALDLAPDTYGIPTAVSDQTLRILGNDLEYLEELLRENEGEIACVIIAMEEILPPVKETLETIRALTRRHGAVLIFDEIKTAFRIALAGAQEHYGVVPDMATISKGMANGLPMAAVLGKREIMEARTRVWTSNTFQNEAVSIAAALVTINEIETNAVVDHLWCLGRTLIQGINTAIGVLGLEEEVEAQGWPLAPMPFVHFKPNMRQRRKPMRDAFYKEIMKQGILMYPDHMSFICFSHTIDDIEATVDVCERGLKLSKAKAG